jgi:hypothetical protein
MLRPGMEVQAASLDKAQGAQGAQGPDCPLEESADQSDEGSR